MTQIKNRTRIATQSDTMFYQISYYPGQYLLHLHLGGDFDWQHYLRAIEECNIRLSEIQQDVALIVSVADSFTFNSADLMKNASKLAVDKPANLTAMLVVGLPPRFQTAHQIFTQVYNHLATSEVYSVDNLEDALALLHPVEEDTARIS